MHFLHGEEPNFEHADADIGNFNKFEVHSLLNETREMRLFLCMLDQCKTANDLIRADSQMTGSCVTSIPFDAPL